MKIFLLTHERELLRPSNTGVLAQSIAPEIVERILWARNTPNPSLLDAINNKNTVLLYPVDDTDAAPIESFENIILLDATWQEARKMFNKSPYLTNLPKAQIKTQAVSQYQLRRNQPEYLRPMAQVSTITKDFVKYSRLQAKKCYIPLVNGALRNRGAFACGDGGVSMRADLLGISESWATYIVAMGVSIHRELNILDVNYA